MSCYPTFKKTWKIVIGDARALAKSFVGLNNSQIPYTPPEWGEAYQKIIFSSESRERDFFHNLGLKETKLGFPLGAIRQYRGIHRFDPRHVRVYKDGFTSHCDLYNPEFKPLHHVLHDVMVPKFPLSIKMEFYKKFPSFDEFLVIPDYVNEKLLGKKTLIVIPSVSMQ